MARKRKADKQVPVQRLPDGQAVAPAEFQQPTSLKPRQVQWPWLLSDTGIFAAALTVAGIGIAALVGMWLIADDVTGVDRAKLQIEALKYGLGFFAAAGAVAALLLAVRRQRLAEHTHQLALDAQQLAERNHQLARDAQAHNERDAAERGVTDLYTKAVEQLGHADAAVRLGGLYALERVAQNNVGQRQTVVDVLCAYLRMPYTPLTKTDLDTSASASGPVPALPLPVPRPAAEGRNPQQELQVRLTAQRILTTHLDTPAEVDPQYSFWPDIDLDLTGAYLVDWNVVRGRIRTALFTHATFSGDAQFQLARFTGDARFHQAAFTGDARFGAAVFSGDASFSEVTDSRNASFGQAVFSGEASFGLSMFSGNADFHGASFSGDADFAQSRVAGRTWFSDVVFSGDVWFSDVVFSGDARFHTATFSGATFFGDARFEGTKFSGRAPFEGTRVAARPGRRDAWPAGWRLVKGQDDNWYRVIRDEPAEPSEAGPLVGSDGGGAGTSDGSPAG